MEMSNTRKHIKMLLRYGFVLLIILTGSSLYAQSVKKYTIRDGKMCIELSRNIPAAELDKFIVQFNINDLGIKSLLQKNNKDSLLKAGWEVELENNVYLLTKTLFAADEVNSAVDKILFAEKHAANASILPVMENRVSFGYNKFKNKNSFAVNDSVVTFFLRSHKDADKVLLAGSFTAWQNYPIAMKRVDSGWIANVKLGYGKHFYKFIIDGEWSIDFDNRMNESDGRGNINSVFYKTNVVFKLSGYKNARKVCLAGNFNNWKNNDIQLYETSFGWELPAFLPNGTHVYRFIVDGEWMYDPGNRQRLPNEYGSYNSVLKIGKPYQFKLNSYTDADKVYVTGNFNGWRKDELLMQKTATGWQLDYVMGPGNYQYKFIVDGKWISDPANPLKDNGSGNSFMVIQPNYTFRLNGFETARQVCVTGDFNGWSRSGYAMKRSGKDWTFPIHLNRGKNRYKFIVDGKWMLDPANKLWEQNEWGTGNSILWLD